MDNKRLANLARSAGYLRHRYHLPREEAGAVSCWLSGVKSECIGTVMELINERNEKL